jgi:Protein of unknown function (DUF998)
MEGWRQQAMSSKDLNRLVDSFVHAHSRAQRAEKNAIWNQIIVDTDRPSHGGYRYLSEYARGPYGALMTSTFFVLSAGSLALSFGLWRSVSSKLHLLPGLLFWLTWACAVFLAGIYTGDLQGTPPTRIGQIHNQMGMIAFPSAAVALPLLSLALRWEKEWRSAWTITMLLSLAVVVCLLAFDRFGQMGLGGLDQRIFLGGTLIWMWILGRKMLIIAKQVKY